MSIRSAIVKAFAQTEVPYSLNGNSYEPEETKTVPITPVPFWPSDVWSGVLSGARVQESNLTRETAYAASALAYLCINYRAKTLQEPPLMVVEETDGGEEWIEEHELNGILAHPNPDFPMRRMIMLTSIYRDIFGAALWLKIRDKGRQTRRMYVFGRHEFKIESTKDRLFGLFRITTRAGEIEAGPEDVVFYAGLDPFDPLGAISPLDVALRILGVGEELRSASKSALVNAMSPSGAISVPELLNDAEFDATMGQLMQQHTGRNRGRPLLLTGGATWQSIGLTIADMMPTELISWIESTVCAVFELHPAAVGVKAGIDIAAGLGGSHVKTAERMVYDRFAIPRWTADAEILTDQLLRDVDFDENHLIRFDVDSIPALQDDMVEKVEIAEKGLGFMTVDERRGLLGLDPVGGDVGGTIFVPAAWMPAEMLIDPPEPKPVPAPFGSPDAEPEPDPNAPPDSEE